MEVKNPAIGATYGYARVSTEEQNEDRQLIALRRAGVDSFLIIDNTELHGLGSSINCLGRRVSSHTTRDAKEIVKLLAMIP